jgi:uncharacterized membrane protein YphA (DoxX/SURF4 family)
MREHREPNGGTHDPASGGKKRQRKWYLHLGINGAGKNAICLPRLSGVGRLFEIRGEFPRSTIRIDAALLALRLARGSGTTVAAILSGMFGGAGPKRFVGDHRLPVSVGYLVRLVQVVSAIGVLLGIFIRLAAVALMVVMLGAILLVHFHTALTFQMAEWSTRLRSY